jgi:hypothetical protein
MTRGRLMDFMGIMVVLYVIVLLVVLVTLNFSELWLPVFFLGMAVLVSPLILRRKVPKGLEAFVEPLSLGEPRRRSWTELMGERVKKARARDNSRL